MNVLVYPSAHPAAPSLVQTLASILKPHYLPQLLTHSQLSVQEYPWHTSCALLLLLSPPTDHTAVLKYIESGGRILAFGVGVRKGTLFSPSHDFGSLSAGLGLGIVKDTTILRVADGSASLYISFSTATGTNADVLINETAVSVSRLPMCPLDLEVRILGRYVEGNVPAGILSQNGLVAMWNCAPPLPDILLSQSLSALGLRLASQRADPSLEPHILPQFLLARPDSWQVQHRVVEALLDHLNLGSVVSDESQPKGESFVFEDANDNFHFHFPSFPSEDRNTGHPILELIPQNFLSNPKVKHVLVPSRPLTSEDERMYTPQFSPSAFFCAINEFRSRIKYTSQGTNQDSWRIGEALIYGEAVSSTQTMFDKNPSFLRALPSPIVSLATVQLAGRGRGGNTWLSPAGCLQMSLKIRIGLKGSSSVPGPTILPSNLVFIQYLYALAIIDACHVLNPTSEWAHKVRLKWPNDIYGLFPSSQNSPISDSKSKPEPRKIGGVLINTSFGGGVADIVIGSGLNVLNAPPIASLAQLASTPTPGLSVERVAAAVLTSFERIWNSFLQNEEQGFHPFMDQYLRSWLHSDQLVTLTNRTPHQSVRIVGITPDHGLLRTVPMGGGEFIDLQPDGNSFDMMKGLISTKNR
ncbi:class II aaRS and biotin synthetase [Suillus bovinus]|uniref:class II aaRS and biotin synthetase n=1 Tax=Suillus bovinus TaxID=48563 RepID=UPI001B85CC18|nr:class II aaRS and biotin synthetase [Suillus bovinus]KAG2147398.1 class II aaRS and biotin synthetase [Suillus bovinus]